MKRMKYSFIKIIALCLVLSMVAPVVANGAIVEPALPMASLYIDEYSATISAMGFGRVCIDFDIWGTGIMDEIGARSIEVYESSDNVNWTYKQTYSCESYLSMMAEDATHCIYNVSYQGVPGRYYKAYICFWSGKNGGGDNRYMWTNVKRAT